MYTIAAFETQYRHARAALVKQALQKNGWSISRAADSLEVGTSTLQRLIATLGLQEEYDARCPPPGRPVKKRDDLK